MFPKGSYVSAAMADDKDFCWELYLELRREIVESQKLRTQIVGFKITLVSAGVGLIVANPDK